MEFFLVLLWIQRVRRVSIVGIDFCPVINIDKATFLLLAITRYLGHWVWLKRTNLFQDTFNLSMKSKVSPPPLKSYKRFSYPFFCDNSLEIKTKCILWTNLISLLPPVTNYQLPNTKFSTLFKFWQQHQKTLNDTLLIMVIGIGFQLAEDAARETLITRLLLTLNEDIMQILFVNS